MYEGLKPVNPVNSESGMTNAQRMVMNRILIVEDDRSQREGLRALLQGSAFFVESAANGVEGFEQLQQGEFDLLLLDVWMPRMSGLDHRDDRRRRSGNIAEVPAPEGYNEACNEVAMVKYLDLSGPSAHRNSPHIVGRTDLFRRHSYHQAF
jgi:CheY-like chemotaxis protein